MKFLQHKKQLLLAADALLIPVLFLCEKLTDLMLSTYSECAWVTLGGKCITCGGTHFVNALLNGHFAEAYQHNQFLFCVMIFSILVYIVLHLSWLCHIPWAEALIPKIFSIPTLIILIVCMLGFFFERNISVFIRVGKILFS